MKLMVKALKARGRKRAPTAPAQGTLFWAKHTVYDDGTHEFSIPAVRDAIGGGYNRVECLQDVSVKVAVMVITSSKKGSTVRAYTLKETINATANNMAVNTEECCKFDFPVPTVESTSMVQIPLDYNLSLEKFIET